MEVSGGSVDPTGVILSEQNEGTLKRKERRKSREDGMPVTLNLSVQKLPLKALFLHQKLAM
jgi:hypothetical protein